MKESTKNLCTVLVPLGLLAITILGFTGKNDDFWILSEMIKKAQKQQKVQEQKIQQLERNIAENQPKLQALQLLRKNAIPANYTDIIGTFRSRVEQVFYASGAQVKTISTPRQLKGVPGVELYEITLAADIRIEELLTVMDTLNKPPVLLWRNITLRPNNVINPEFLTLNAVIGAICFKDNADGNGGAQPGAKKP